MPPPIRRNEDGSVDDNWFADVIEWFLNFDERTARIRHSTANDLFEWKQQDDEANGVGTYPFENAEARFAIGVFQAVQENDKEPLLGLWMNDLLAAIHDAKESKREITEANNLLSDPAASFIDQAEKLTTGIEKRLFLSSCWAELLYSAEARVLGWIYQEMYGRPFTPAT